LSDASFERRLTTIFNWAIQKLAECSRERAQASDAEIDRRFDDLMAILVGALRA
jgi:hypothetical protein